MTNARHLLVLAALTQPLAACAPASQGDAAAGGGGAGPTVVAAATNASASAASSTRASSATATVATTTTVATTVATATSASTGDVPTSLDLHDVTLFDNPADLADWAETTRITHVDIGNDGVHVEFDRQDGPDRWPDVTPPGWDGPLQYTMGLAERIDGVWYGSAAIQFWYGLSASGGNLAVDDQIANNWYYDARWGELEGYQPATGEVIGIFVVAGNVRGVLDGSQSPVLERSNVVLLPMPDASGASYDF